MNFNELATKLEDVIEVLPIAAGRLKREVASTILNDLIHVTPVDTGKAVSNWQVSNEPVFSERGPFVPSPKGRVRAGKWTHAADPAATMLANAAIAFETGKVIIDVTPPGVPIFISNALPYIVVLDQGSSEQAPAGFVDRAVILGRSTIDAAKLLL